MRLAFMRKLAVTQHKRRTVGRTASVALLYSGQLLTLDRTTMTTIEFPVVQ
jgi:hypothetical protein